MPVMQSSSLTPRQWWDELKSRPTRAKFGFGKKAAVVHVDMQRAYTDLEHFSTAYETDPNQITYINQLSDAARKLHWPVIFTFVAYANDASDAGVWGTRTHTVDSLQNIKLGSERAQLDARIDFQPERGDVLMQKRMPSAFFETHLRSLLIWHQIDTLIVTGGSTSGCVRATVVDSLAHGYRTIVPEQCVADKHEIPHYANLCDMLLKYADVEDISTVLKFMERCAS
jgi:maleamate amidohydrolase